MVEEILPVIYTDRANANSLTIKNFILIKFTQKEVDNFYKMLATFERVVSAFPEIYPLSTENQEVHRAVLSKQLSVFYTIIDNEILVIGMIDNRMGYDKWPKI
jgi:plasmid stabilization system protein ParE